MKASVPSMKSGALALAILSLTISSAAAKSGSNATGTPPVIDEQPIGRVVSVGGHVALSVAAHGSTPLSFQWFRNTNSLPVTNDTRRTGASNAVLNIDPVQTNDTSGYSVVVMNSAGSITSAVVAVTVNDIAVQATVQGNTGLLMRIFGPVGEVYRIETGNFGPPWTTNGYTTNVTGEARYFFRFASGGASIRVLFDHMKPVLYPGTPGLARAYGKLNQAWRFDTSQDLQTWTPLYTVTNLTGWVTLGDPRDHLPQTSFYRIAPP